MCIGNIYLMNEDEKTFYNEKKRIHYRQECINVLKSILPLKKIQFALLDQITMNFNISNNIDGLEESAESKLWLYVDFVKPGKQTFCVKRHHSETVSDFYVHKFLC